MLFKKKDKESKPKKEKKVPVMKVGTHKKTVIALWLVLIASVSFGVYKNFTAIDMHTVHEKEVIEQRIVDTNKIENFVKAFAKSSILGVIRRNPLKKEPQLSTSILQRACRI